MLEMITLAPIAGAAAAAPPSRTGLNSAELKRTGGDALQVDAMPPLLDQWSALGMAMLPFMRRALEA